MLSSLRGRQLLCQGVLRMSNIRDKQGNIPPDKLSNEGASIGFFHKKVSKNVLLHSE